jgi:hypothetical protein
MFIGQQAQPSPARQAHHRHKPGARHEVRVVEHRRGGPRSVRELHLRDALRTDGNRTFDKSDLPSTQGHSRFTTRSDPRTIGGSRLNLNPWICSLAFGALNE